MHSGNEHPRVLNLHRVTIRMMSRLCYSFFAGLLLLTPGFSWAENRVLIDATAYTLTVLDDNQPLLVIEGISIGRFGAGRDKKTGDGISPLGTYHVTSIKQSKRFHFFIGLDYPSAEDTERGLEKGLLTQEQAEAIRAAHARGKLPPQDTPLGGYIGLHGIGAGDPAVHASYNWTRGCIAVTNDQIEQLLDLIQIGTEVKITQTGGKP